MDPSCPTEGGVRPGCGAIVAMLEAATGKKAFSLGKPSPVMFRAARKELGLRTAETIMIGDTMETDILGATQMGYFSVLVLSGGTRKDELSNFSYRPDLVVSSVADLLETEALSKFFNQNGGDVGATAGLKTKESSAFT
jgi:NagD protein